MTENTIAAKLIAKSAKPETAKSEASDYKPDPGQRILDTFKRSTEKELLKEQKLSRERDKAIVANLPHALDVLEEGMLRDFFVVLEGSASASQRKLIETHPLRPDGVAELVAQVDAARAKEAEKVKAHREAERREKEREQFERLRQKFEPANGEVSVPNEGKPKG